MSQEWYYSVDGKQLGPVSPGELKKLTEARSISQTDLVWKEGMAEWVPAKSIKGLWAGSTTPAGGTAAKTGDQAAAQAEPAEERPSSRGRPRDEEEEDRPRRRRDADEGEEQDRPRSRRRVEDEDEDRPARRRRDEDEDVRPRKRRGGRVPEDTANKKMVAGLLGILLGGWGIHKFYLGMTTPGILQIVITVCTCGAGGIIGLIEGIIYMTKSDEDFHQMYVVEQKGWF